MPSYRAGPGGGLFGSHAFPDSRPRIDIEGGINALTQGASSLIRQAFLRKQAEAEMARQAQQDELHRQQIAYQQEQDRLNREERASETAYKHLQDEAEGKRKDAALRLEQRKAGLQPETRRYDVPPMTSATIGAVRTTPPSPIRGAMQPGQVPPIAQPLQPGMQPTQITHPGGAVVSPESYDPEQGQAGVVAAIRAEGAQALEGAKQEGRMAVEKLKQENRIAFRRFAQVQAEHGMRVRQTLADAAKSKGISKTMTGNAAVDLAMKMADGLIGYRGSYDEALEYLNSPDGVVYREKLGVTPEFLQAAYAKWLKTAEGQAGRLQTSTFATPQESAKQVKETGRILRQGQGGATAPAAPPTPAAPPARPTPTPTPAAPVPAPKPAAKAPAGPVKPSPFTDEEMRQAQDALPDGDFKAVSDYIINTLRKKKAPAAKPKAGKPTASSRIGDKRFVVERDADGNVTGFVFARDRENA